MSELCSQSCCRYFPDSLVNSCLFTSVLLSMCIHFNIKNSAKDALGGGGMALLLVQPHCLPVEISIYWNSEEAQLSYNNKKEHWTIYPLRRKNKVRASAVARTWERELWAS